MSPAMAVSCSSPLLHPYLNQQGISHRSSGCQPFFRPDSVNGKGSFIAYKAGLVVQNTKSSFSCSVGMADGHSSDNQGKLNLDRMMDKTREVWNGLPKPIKNFPWNRVLDSFIQLILDVAIAVVKYLSAPMLAVSSLSEMSYCAHERKLFLVPIPLVLGFAVAGILKETAQELSPLTKNADVPWHMIAIAILLVLLKLPGPYYPYWGRMFIPHFANGGLLRVFLMMYFWYQKPKKSQLLQDAESSDQN
ncbi:uncharacterized protein LOC110686067 isoform X1 [Chenopodium quinoa]|uniref:EMB1273 n=2 Tax=Chenopodium quinoa TaxID=63459 RepID=A0A803L7M8_CHEQI|nr:uncharacterized protein LOC110686067 isoform X1 [Chenopodium quinoa]XP_021718343.1 uncharacterized protein LOC110686067 isoform X1 [Chenopodium quinoa]XP_021718344.1 uncharacterized protein LOC110686067 isoform X1 [Chenopodium quinoa]